MKRKHVDRVFLLLLSVIVGISGFYIWRSSEPRKPGQIPPGDYGPTIDYAIRRITKLMDQNHLPSVAAVLIDDQNTVWQETRGRANLEEEIAAGPDTNYKMWSVAKVFTAIETMRLVEEGLVDLDAPITTYLPGFSIQSRFPESDPITVRSILTHRSGLPRNECHWIDFRLDVLADSAASLKDCRQVYPVGTRYKYSNMAFDLLGHLLEKLRGGLYPEIMRDRLLIPLRMENSSFIKNQLPQKMEIAQGYEYYKGEYYPIEQGDITSLPSGNLYSTLDDMSKFVKFIFKGGGGIGGQLISSSTLDDMFLTQISDPRDPQPLGLGWKTGRVFGSEKLVWHDGGPGEGIGSLVAMLPERKLGVIMIANSTTFEGSLSLPVAINLLELMLETRYGLTPNQPITPERKIPDPETLIAYTGKYIVFGEVMEVKQPEDHLIGSVMGFRFNLVPLNATTFKAKHLLIDLGLANLLGAPIDLRQLEIEFIAGDETYDDYLIINMDDMFYEICPRYPQIEEVPADWEDITGEYDLYARLANGEQGAKVLGNTSIFVEDGVLQMAGVVGPLLPINETEIIILSSPFEGETMVLDPDTGTITHQMIIYVPR